MRLARCDLAFCIFRVGIPNRCVRTCVEAKKAWYDLGVQLPQERIRAALRMRRNPETGVQDETASSIKGIIRTIHRQHVVRSTSCLTEMDELSFKANFKYVRGWPPQRILDKWQEIVDNPGKYRTSQVGGHLNVWVPQNRNVSLEDVQIGELSVFRIM